MTAYRLTESISLHSSNLYKLWRWFEGCLFLQFLTLSQLLDICTLAIMFGQIDTTRTETSFTVLTIDGNPTLLLTKPTGHSYC
jgi:hypothetical protein